jgi:hypothetical protein
MGKRKLLRRNAAKMEQQSEEAKRRRATMKKYLILTAPLVAGGIAAGLKYKEGKDRISELEGELMDSRANENMAIVGQGIKIGLKMMEDPEQREELIKLRDQGTLTREQQLRLGLKVLQEDPEAVSNAVRAKLTSMVRQARLNREIREVEQELPDQCYNAFVNTSALLYGTLLLYFLYEKVVRGSKEIERRIAKAYRKMSAKRHVVLEKPPKGPEEAPDAEKVMKGGTGLLPPADMRNLVALTVLEASTRHKKKEKPKKKKSRPSMFSEESAERLKELGFKPPVVEKALIRAFKVLNPTRILIDDRYGDFDAVENKMRSVIRDTSHVEKLLTMLENENMLRFKDERKLVTLEPDPITETGRLIMNDIKRKVNEMQRVNQRNSEVCIA